MATKTVTGKVTKPDGSAAANAGIRAALSQPCVIAGTQEVVASVVAATSAADGTYSLTLQANNDLSPTGTYYTVTSSTLDGGYYQRTIVVPQTAGPFVITSIETAPPTVGATPSHVSTLTVDGAAGFTSGPVTIPGLVTYDWGGGTFNVKSSLNPSGAAKGDAQFITDAVMNGSTAVLTSASNKFAAADVGKLIVVPGAGAAGVPLSTTIASYQNAGQVTLAAASATAVSANTTGCTTWGSDDYASIAAAITGAQAANGEVLLPGVVVGYMCSQVPTISTGMTFRGTGCRELWGSVISNGNAINQPAVAPFLTGSVLIMAALNTDGLKVTCNGTTPNMYDFGIRFAGLYNSTGHGVNAQPPADGGNFDQGMTSGEWRSIKVYGHDGNHYGFRFINETVGTYDHLRSYGGGGLFERGDSVRDAYGNTLFNHPYMVVFLNGSAHAYRIEANAANNLNLLEFHRPQAFVWAPTIPITGTTAPTAAQACFSNDLNVSRVGVYQPDWESNVGATTTYGKQGVVMVGAFGGNLNGVIAQVGVIPENGAYSALALFGLDNQSQDVIQIWDALTGGVKALNVLAKTTYKSALQARKIFPGTEDESNVQFSGGIIHSTGVPSNSNGVNNDWCISDNGHLYFKAAGSWVQKI